MTDAYVLVDAHVHVYPKFQPARLLFSAWDNFARHSQAHCRPDASWQGVLMLAESGACDWFNEARAAGVSEFDTWRIVRAAGDDISLVASGPARKKLFIVAGRQVNTREGVEVLTLATAARIPDRLPLEETIQRGIGANAVVVLPWGAGKWVGSRGRLVARAMEAAGRVFPGDNGGRPWLWPRPMLFKNSEALGRPVLPGSDPLPLAGQESRVGSCGFALRGALRESSPGTEIREHLLASAAPVVAAFGRPDTLRAFATNQLRLRLA